jgi:hypothetical protein
MSVMTSGSAPLLRGSIATMLGLTAAVLGLTWLFLGTRGLLVNGGMCAVGGPFQIANPCPEGIPTAILGGIGIGAVGLIIYSGPGLRVGPRLTILILPALFLSLGWNFVYFGIDLPGGAGVSVGLLIAAGLFLIMGGGPLLFMLNRNDLRSMLWSDGAKLIPDPVIPPGPLPSVPQVRPRRPTGSATVPVPPPEGGPDGSTAPDDLSRALDRLYQLHLRGALTADEYSTAKRRLLGQDPTDG